MRGKVCFISLGGEALARQQHPAQTLHPEVYHPVGSAPSRSRRGPPDCAGRRACRRRRRRPWHVRASGRVIWKPLSFSRPGEVQAGHRDTGVARLDQRLAQQMDVVGGTAAAAGLGDEQGRVVEVVLAAVQRIEELADDQQRRIAGVVVDVFQAQLRHMRCRSCPVSRTCSRRSAGRIPADGTG